MNFKLKDKWVTALRSGKYEQGSGRLRNGDKFCCLGVLCDVIDPTGWNLLNSWTSHDNHQDNHKVSINVVPDVIQNVLIKMNDSPSNKRSFNDIADWIESNVKVEDVNT